MSEITKEMLYNYFANQATALQKRAIDEWAKDPANRELFYECLAQWESQNLQYSSDADAALTRHRNRMALKTSAGDADGAGRNTTRRTFLRLSIAASFVIALLIGGYRSKDKLLFKTFATTYGETKTVSLKDGTKVVLNSNSTLTIPRFGFGEYTREVSLVGEGNFSVAHLPGNQQFVVRTVDGHDIVVLGTEFTVYTRLHRFKVALNKGKIQLRYKERDKNQDLIKDLIMVPGELVTIDSRGKAVSQKATATAAVPAWKDNPYVFEHTSLQEICALFKDDFGMDVVIADPEISSWSVSGSFKASTAQELLEALAVSSGLVYKQDNKTIIIHSISVKNNP